MTQFVLLTGIAWKGTLVLGAAFGTAALLRRSSAAARHYLWTVALALLLLLPPAIALVPQWSLRVAPAPAVPSVQSASRALSSEPAVLVVRPSSAPAASFPWLWLWAAGSLLAAARFTVGAWHTRAILRHARPAAYARTVTDEAARVLGVRRFVAVLEAAEVPVPLACGLWRPIVALPDGAAEWSPARLRTALLHELAHIGRCDLAAQMLAQAACCLYWFHPLAWMAAARLRREREHACDDAVLAAGAGAHEYASDLVNMARTLAARRRLWADAPAMAESCNLESRVRALFDPQRNRRPLRMRMAAATGVAALALLAPLASMRLQAQSGSGALGGVVMDPSRAVVPNARVTAKNQDGSNQETTVTDAAGMYRFIAIPAGKYTLEFASPGFKLKKVDVTIAAGQGVRQDAGLELGDVSEAMTIRAQRPGGPAPAPTGAQRIRVGGNVQPARLIQQVRPEYPAELQQAGVQGVVLIRAIISKDGDVLSPQVINTEIDPRLAQLALSAAKQWRYQPSLLNGEPVEVVNTISIDFRLN